jgi:hypothetical protein
MSSTSSNLQMLSTSNPVHGETYESEEDYASMTELDEENVNWGRLCARILSILLLIGGIILVSRKDNL